GVSMTDTTAKWQPELLRVKPTKLIVSWLLTAGALAVTAAILPGVHIADAGGALVVALVVAGLNAVIPPLFAALRLPLTLVFGFLLALVLSALILQVAAD